MKRLKVGDRVLVRTSAAEISEHNGLEFEIVTVAPRYGYRLGLPDGSWFGVFEHEVELLSEIATCPWCGRMSPSFTASGRPSEFCYHTVLDDSGYIQ